MPAVTQTIALTLTFSCLAMSKLPSASGFLQPSSLCPRSFNPARAAGSGTSSCQKNIISCQKRTITSFAMSTTYNGENLLESMSRACSDALGREVNLETSRGGGASGGGTYERNMPMNSYSHNSKVFHILMKKEPIYATYTALPGTQ